MPRCQRTFRRLPEPPGRDRNGGRETGRWLCPHCAPPETYAVVRDADLLQYAGVAEETACAEFGRPSDRSRATLLLYGLRPECALEPDDRRYDVYLQQDSDALQLRLQIGHEIFHRVCSQGRVYHWTHEMLACLFTVRLLRRQGFPEYAEQTARLYQEEAQGFPLAALLATDLWTMAVYPYGFYGRAYVTGRALQEAVGWDALRRLARCALGPGGPDVAVWLGGLPAEVRETARAAIDARCAEMALVQG